jgi:hypothetical protein
MNIKTALLPLLLISLPSQAARTFFAQNGAAMLGSSLTVATQVVTHLRISKINKAVAKLDQDIKSIQSTLVGDSLDALVAQSFRKQYGPTIQALGDGVVRADTDLERYKELNKKLFKEQSDANTFCLSLIQSLLQEKKWSAGRDKALQMLQAADQSYQQERAQKFKKHAGLATASSSASSTSSASAAASPSAANASSAPVKK